jgi:hypothetical protein
VHVTGLKMIAWFLVVTFVAVRSAELPNFVILFADDMGSGKCRRLYVHRD